MEKNGRSTAVLERGMPYQTRRRMTSRRLVKLKRAVCVRGQVLA
jgi:hypothetical protein